MNKLYRKYIHNHWWFKRKKINQQFLNHVCNKFGINGKIINAPYINENDNYIYGHIVISTMPKKFYKYKNLFEFNDYFITVE